MTEDDRFRNEMNARDFAQCSPYRKSISHRINGTRAHNHTGMDLSCTDAWKLLHGLFKWLATSTHMNFFIEHSGVLVLHTSPGKRVYIAGRHLRTARKGFLQPFLLGDCARMTCCSMRRKTSQSSFYFELVDAVGCGDVLIDPDDGFEAAARSGHSCVLDVGAATAYRVVQLMTAWPTMTTSPSAKLLKLRECPILVSLEWT